MSKFLEENWSPFDNGEGVVGVTANSDDPELDVDVCG